MYVKNLLKINTCIYKAHNVEFEKIRKDIEKLVKERIAGNWFHTLKNIDRGTLPSLFEKWSAALKSCAPLLSQPEKGWYNDISLIFCVCVLDKQWACTKQFFYQSALQTQQSFDQYIEEFFQLEYSTTRDEMTIVEPHGWVFYTPEKNTFPDTISYKASVFAKREYDSTFHETILGLFSTPAHALSEICKHCHGQYLQVTSQSNEHAMVYVTRDDVIYEAIAWHLDKQKTGYIDLPIGQEYAPYENQYIRIEKLND